ncbi:peptidase C65 Otubain-domain-containing protein [Xylariaceae sp. FL1272]|nr:peptidase C65 Otubain-domain-containing protein [Xylariaceae sp. FL1272]
MFQAQPTPYGQFIPYGFHLGNEVIPEYTFSSPPLLDNHGQSQFGGRPVQGNSEHGRDGTAVVGRGPAAATAPGNYYGSGISSASTNTASASPNAHSGHSGHSGHHSSRIPPSTLPRHQHQHQHHLQTHHPHNQPQQQPQSRPTRHQHSHQHPLTHRFLLGNRDGAQRQRARMDQQHQLGDIAQQEAAARDYMPELEGPLVGEKTSSQSITEEYARADPTYVAKTLALPQTYSHYRPIQGDGNCGWRAIGFAYFEALARCRNVDLIQQELERIVSLNNYIENEGGQDPSIFELMVDETFSLFNEITAAMSEGSDPMTAILAKFNEPNVSQCLVYHLRLLACARLKGERARFEPYIDADVESYVQSTILPVNREIDHVCVVLIHDILLRPANIVLEIAYLDRSEGSQVNVHRLPEEADAQDASNLGPMIYLLYRPGHYDILYRDAPVLVTHTPPPVNLQVHRVTSFTPHRTDFQNPIAALQGTPYLDLTSLAMIPAAFDTPLGPPSGAPSPMTEPYAASPASPWISQHFEADGTPAAPSQSSPPQQQQQHPLRFSKYNFPNLPEMAGESSSDMTSYDQTFTTNTFKNSHFNVAHYNNMNFQPEMYRPDSEEEISNSGSGRSGGRKRSSDHSSVIKREK